MIKPAMNESTTCCSASTKTPRDASSDINNLAYALDFSSPVVAGPTLPKPSVPFFPEPCFARLFGDIFGSETTTNAQVKQPVTMQWHALGKQAAANGFAVK